jgi:hypothetical protein
MTIENVSQKLKKKYLLIDGTRLSPFGTYSRKIISIYKVAKDDKRLIKEIRKQILADRDNWPVHQVQWGLLLADDRSCEYFPEHTYVAFIDTKFFSFSSLLKYDFRQENDHRVPKHLHELENWVAGGSDSEEIDPKEASTLLNQFIFEAARKLGIKALNVATSLPADGQIEKVLGETIVEKSEPFRYGVTNHLVLAVTIVVPNAAKEQTGGAVSQE